jgi:tetratricopeptide (TPR) repeat protein
MLRAILVLLLIPLATVGCSRSDTRVVDRTGTVVTRGVVRSGDREGRAIWFELGFGDSRFVLVGSGYDPRAIFEAINDSNETGRSVTVRFDSDAVGIDSQDGQKPAYVVREITYDDRLLPGVAGAAGRWGRSPSVAEAALARGLAAYKADNYALASAEVSKSIESGSLEPELLALAYKTRGNALADEVTATRTQPDEAGDRQLMRALEDMQKWASLDPDEPVAVSNIAHIQRSLGAYEEAFESYAEISRKWPSRYYRTAILVGATHRQMGKPEEALRALDELVEEHGPQDGMMFHYHRGWTLSELRRYADAVEEFTTGLKAQPDYTWALIKRSCALAQLGRVPEALKDMEQALDLLRKSDPELFVSKGSREMNARTEAIVGELRQATASAGSKPNSIPCDGYPDYGGEWPRTRSQWLP